MHHYINLRCTTGWFDLHRLWNNYHNRFSEYSLSDTDTIKKKEKKKITSYDENSGSTLLNTFPIYHIALLTVVIMLYIIPLVDIYLQLQVYTF